jgi:hypothetical protein
LSSVGALLRSPARNCRTEPATSPNVAARAQCSWDHFSIHVSVSFTVPPWND